jgi:hypothetical protein
VSESSIIAAARSGDISAVDRLLGGGADVNERDEHGWTALNWAAGSDDARMVAALLERGADPTLTGRDNRTPLMIARAAGRAEAVAILTEAEQKRGVWKDPREGRPYCKAFLVGELRRFAEWPPAGAGAGPDDQIVYLHHDFTVTRSMWHGEDVLFDATSPDWKAFCERTLAFAIPADLL